MADPSLRLPILILVLFWATGLVAGAQNPESRAEAEVAQPAPTDGPSEESFRVPPLSEPWLAQEAGPEARWVAAGLAGLGLGVSVGAGFWALGDTFGHLGGGWSSESLRQGVFTAGTAFLAAAFFGAWLDGALSGFP